MGNKSLRRGNNTINSAHDALNNAGVRAIHWQRTTLMCVRWLLMDLAFKAEYDLHDKKLVILLACEEKVIITRLNFQ